MGEYYGLLYPKCLEYLLINRFFNLGDY